MKALLLNIWNGKKTTAAAALIGTFTVLAEEDIIPPPARAGLLALTALLALYGPTKPHLT